MGVLFNRPVLFLFPLLFGSFFAPAIACSALGAFPCHFNGFSRIFGTLAPCKSPVFFPGFFPERAIAALLQTRERRLSICDPAGPFANIHADSGACGAE